MNRKKSWMLLLLLSVSLLGCTPKQNESVDETVLPETTAAISVATQPQIRITKQELLSLFNGYAYADPANRVAADCAVVTDDAYDLLGAVMYTEDDSEGCAFDFLGKDGMVVGRVGIDAVPGNDNTLEYLGNGMFACSMIRSDGSKESFRITYSYDEATGTNFKVEET